MIWDPNLLLIEKLTKAELVRLANEQIEKERQRCHDIVNRVGLENWHPADALKLIDEGR
jgi:hypothetical protein